MAPFRCAPLILSAVVMLAGLPLLAQQSQPSPPSPPPLPPIKIIVPIVDKTAGKVTIPAAFWNEHLADWVEVGICGRPSNFLHETVAAITTTRSLLEKALREAGCHDADAWVDSVNDFPRVRGDRVLILLSFVRDGKPETFALDELIEYRGWGVSLGPVGWMFKGDPGGGVGASRPAPTPDSGSDSSKILHDDPQMALTFKNLQNMSQSCIDWSLAYDDWVYPTTDMARNISVLPEKVFNSNGEIPVMLSIQKVTEEQFLTEIVKVWHDSAVRDYILKQLPTARQIDKDKAELWALRPELTKPGHVQAGSPAERQLLLMKGKAAALMASIGRGYAMLDAAWAGWMADHAAFETTDAQTLEALKRDVALYREHMMLQQTRAEQLAMAEQAALDQSAPPDAAGLAKARGREIEARARAMAAENQHARDFWKMQLSRLDQNDPRTDWLKQVTLQAQLTEARNDAAAAGIAYGAGLQAPVAPADLPAVQGRYAQATMRVAIIEVELQLAELNFDISKHELFPDDPELPGLKKQKDRLDARLKELQAATQPAQK